MAAPVDLIEQVKGNDPKSEAAIWYYVKLLEPDPTDAEWNDPTKRSIYKMFWVLQQAIEHLEAAKDAVHDARTLDGATGVNLDNYADLWAVPRPSQPVFDDDDPFYRQWIRFEALRRRCPGTPDAMKLVAAALLTIIHDPNGTYETVPWDACAEVLDQTEPTRATIADDTWNTLASWTTLTRLSWQFAPPHYIDNDELAYMGLIVPGDLLDTPTWLIDVFASADNGAETDPDDEGFWFIDDSHQGFDAGLWDGHWIITELLEVLWDAAGVGIRPDVIVDGFGFAANESGSSTSDPQDVGYWFIDDATSGFDAGRMPGSVTDSGAVEIPGDMSISDPPGWAIGQGLRRWVTAPDVAYVESGLLD